MPFSPGWNRFFSLRRRGSQTRPGLGRSETCPWRLDVSESVLLIKSARTTPSPGKKSESITVEGGARSATKKSRVFVGPERTEDFIPLPKWRKKAKTRFGPRPHRRPA
jgi:hypothetical protein